MVHAVFLDLSKDFDSLSQGIFQKKLKTLNFSHSCTECIESFLTKRLQQGKVNGIVSEWMELKQGVPQGTVLFNLYVNGFSNQISEKAQIIQYDDDCLPYCSDSESEIAVHRLHKNLVELETYISFNRLNLNESKTEFIILSC